KLGPPSERAHRGRAVALQKLGRWDDSIADCTEAIRLGCSDPEFSYFSYHRRALAYLNLKQYDRALADSQEVIQMKPELSFGYYDRGMSLAGLDKLDQGIEDLSKAVRLDPKAAWYFNCRADLYEKKGDAAKAKADREMAARLQP